MFIKAAFIFARTPLSESTAKQKAPSSSSKVPVRRGIPAITWMMVVDIISTLSRSWTACALADDCLCDRSKSVISCRRERPEVRILVTISDTTVLLSSSCLVRPLTDDCVFLSWHRACTPAGDVAPGRQNEMQALVTFSLLACSRAACTSADACVCPYTTLGNGTGEKDRTSRSNRNISCNTFLVMSIFCFAFLTALGNVRVSPPISDLISSIFGSEYAVADACVHFSVKTSSSVRRERETSDLKQEPWAN